MEEIEESILSSESLEANPPVSPMTPAVVAPDPTYSRGGSTRSGPSTRGENKSEGAAFVSEQNFRDIVSFSSKPKLPHFYANPPRTLRSGRRSYTTKYALNLDDTMARPSTDSLVF